MPAIQGRSRKPDNGVPKKLVQAWVDQDVFEAAEEATTRLGVSRTRYIEALIRADREHCIVRPEPGTSQGQGQLPLGGESALAS